MPRRIDPDRFAFWKALSPATLKRLAGMRLDDVVALEARRAKKRLEVLRARRPGAAPRELAVSSIESAKAIAGLTGSISGAVGLLGVPADLVVMAWLQIRMLCDVATAYGVELRFARARGELLALLGEANGIGPLQRSGPKVLGKVAGLLAERGGFATLGRALPLVAAPITAWLNNHHVQLVGEAALRHWDGFERASAKTRAATEAP